MKNFGRLLPFIVSVTTFASASVADVQDVPSSLRRSVSCMLEVLRNTPRVDQVDSGVMVYLGSSLPFVGYAYTERDGRVGVVKFVALNVNARLPEQKDEISKGSVVNWVASLGGLSTPGVPPPTLGTGLIVKEWKLKCGVTASALFN